MASVKAIMQCLDIDTGGTVSILGDFFGFIRGRVPAEQAAGVTASVSVLQQIQAVKGAHLHVNVIRVGFDAIGGGATALDTAHEKLDYALYRTRVIYRHANLGVGRVLHWSINAADANGADDLGSEGECDDLIADWSVPNDGVDAFVVRNISDSDFVGKASDIRGECDKEAKDDGVCAGEINRDFEPFPRIYAHEIGHHLGLPQSRRQLPRHHDRLQQPHGPDPLCYRVWWGRPDRSDTHQQPGSTMRSHCAVKPGC